MVDGRRRVVDPVPKRAIYSIMCIFFIFDRKSVQYVSKHRYFTMVCYVKGIYLPKKRYTCLFGDNSPAAKDPVPICALSV